MVCRKGAEEVVQGAHEISPDWSETGFEEVLGEVVDTEFERPQTLSGHFWGTFESEDEGSHEMLEEWKEVGKANGDRQAQLDQKISNGAFRMLNKAVEILQEFLEQGKDFIVDAVEFAAADGSEERTNQEIVAHWLSCLGCQRERVHNEASEMRGEDGFVGFWQEVYGHEDHLEQSEGDVGRSRFLVA